jgi:hypothetical protein
LVLIRHSSNKELNALKTQIYNKIQQFTGIITFFLNRVKVPFSPGFEEGQKPLVYLMGNFTGIS